MDFLKFISIFFILSITLARPANAVIFSISTPIFSAGFDHNDGQVLEPSTGPLGNTISRAGFTDSTLFFSFWVIGGSGAFSIFDKNESLSVIVEFQCRGDWVREQRVVGMNQSLWIRNRPALEEQLLTNGFFSWRAVATVKLNPQCEEMEFWVKDDEGRGRSPPGSSVAYSRSIIFTE